MNEQVIDLENLHVLIVEDDENNRYVLVKLLQVEGILPENIHALAGDPGPYLQTWLPDGIDLILLDLDLPNKDGFTILHELKANPVLSSVPVVAVTANVMRQDVERARLAGFDGFIGKPINGPRLRERLKHILSGGSVWTAG